METLLNFCYYITLFLIPIAFYSLFFKQTTSNRFFTNRDWFYFMKYILAKPAIKKYQRKCKLSLNEGAQKILENPKEIRTEIYTDNNFIYGTDQKGNNLSLRFTIRSSLAAEVFICLRLASGAIYTLPGEKIKVYSLSSWQWKTKELNIEVLEPFKRLRITYNGLLSTATQDVEHVQFSFIWVAAGAPKFNPQDATASLFADALARQHWKDGSWMSLLGDERGYEQFGALRGFVRGDSFDDDLLLNLPSCRTRFWCTNEKLAVNRTFHLFSVGQDGTLISLWVKSLRNGCDGLQNGSVFIPNGNILSIRKSDIRLESLATSGSIPSAFTVHVYVENKTFRTVFHVNTKRGVHTATHSDHMTPKLSNLPADCDQNTQQAKSIIEFWYASKTKSRDISPPVLLTENKTKIMPNCYVSNLSDEQSQIVQLTGGKGCSLAMLSSLKSNDFIVPNGFVITVNAFNKQLEVNFNMKKSVVILDDICCGRLKGNIEHACSATVKTFENEDILSELKKSIVHALDNTRKDPAVSSDRWAVRSSAIGEDSEELSAAGQNETFLGCTTSEDVFKAVSSCWASLFTYQSVKYRHQHGLPVASEMAVVVQRMVPADCAGVLFTYHPSTSNPAQLVITANHGLGESVVSGRSEPDTIILERTFDNDFTIKSKVLGRKDKIVKMVDVGVEIQDGYEGFSVTDNQALELGKVGVLLEEKFGSARDIEWAYYEGRLYLLQARPITTLNTWSDEELLREFDVAVMSDDGVYTVANTGEVLPGAISVLSLSSVVKSIDDGIQMNMVYKKDPYAFKSLSTFQHHLFVDVISGIHVRNDETISIASKILDLAIFGHPIINETIHFLAVQRFGIATVSDKLNDIIDIVKLLWQNEENTKKCRELAKNYDFGIDNTRDTLKDIYDKIDKSIEQFTDAMYYHSCTTRTSVTYQIISMIILMENNEDFNVDHYNDIALLLSSCEDVVSAEIPAILANIRTILIQNNKATEFTQVRPEDGQNWLRNHVPEAAKIFDQFLNDHGHRGMREFDIYNATWGSNPSEVVKMIQANCKGTSSKQEKITKSVDEVIDSLVSPKKSSTKTILRFLMKKSRKAVGFREQTKSESIRFVDKIRKAYRILADKMALAGLIPQADLIYHLSHFEVGQILDSSERHPLLITKALKRQKLYPKWDQLKFPEISYGIPRHESRDFIPRTGNGKVKCEGTPVCAGIIQSRACVITDLSEINELQDGDILITYCTDIAWSPYFPLLGGIVTELGGLVSHGAVIAREYGLPCIVGAKDATKLFKTGDIVVLSGKNGVIELV